MAKQLTDAQREIKLRLDRGLGAREIAEDLGVTRNAVYQQIQRMRKHGILEADFTPTGAPPRETHGGPQLLAQQLHELVTDAGEELPAAGVLALIAEMRRTRDELDSITRRLSAIMPR